jgi:arylsulfatase A-like enzyme
MSIRLLAVAACLAHAPLLPAAPAAPAAPAGRTPPNVVLVLADDMGYADLACYGGRPGLTPHLDRLARQGVRFTDFYAAQAVCSASRAALLTGCYPNRTGVLGALRPGSPAGLAPGVRTIADVLKGRGYATALYGKWHLGDAPAALPTRHGFDDYFGLPYSHDMAPGRPDARVAFPPLPLMRGERVVATNPDLTQLTTWYTERSVAFIEKNKARPFFLYLAHNMPHVPLAVSAKHKGKSGRGPYGDVMMELDWSVGQVLAALQMHGLDRNTLVLFASDNGPWLRYGAHGGAAGPLREGKATTWEGGVRVPFLARWPGRIAPGGVRREPVMNIDVLPTLAALAGAELPGRTTDGKDLWPLLSGQEGAKGPHEALYFYMGRELQAVRAGRWKLHLPHAYRSLAGGAAGQDGRAAAVTALQTPLALYDLEKDPGENDNQAGARPGVVRRLEALAGAARAKLGDNTRGAKDRGAAGPDEAPTHAPWWKEGQEADDGLVLSLVGPSAAVLGGIGLVAVLTFNRRGRRPRQAADSGVILRFPQAARRPRLAQ